MVRSRGRIAGTSPPEIACETQKNCDSNTTYSVSPRNFPNIRGLKTWAPQDASYFRDGWRAAFSSASAVLHTRALQSRRNNRRHNSGCPDNRVRRKHRSKELCARKADAQSSVRTSRYGTPQQIRNPRKSAMRREFFASSMHCQELMTSKLLLLASKK